MNKISTPMGDVRLSFTGEKVAQELTEEIRGLLYSTLLDHLRRKSVITLHDLEEAGMPNVTLRLATVQLFFDGIRSTVHSVTDSILDAVVFNANISEVDKLRFLSSMGLDELSGEPSGFDGMSLDEARQQLTQLKRDYISLVDHGPYRRGLREMGARVGWSFALNLIRHARRDKGEIPLTYDKLLQFWSIFDSATDIAESIEVTLTDPEATNLSVTVQHSFLMKGRVQNQHIHCPFLEGYVLGVVDGLFINWNHWILAEPYKSPTRHLRVRTVKENDSTDLRCYLLVDFYEDEEKTRRPASRLANAALNLEKGLVKEAAVETRGVLEECLRISMGLQEKAQLKFTAFLKQAEEAGIKLSYKRLRDLYDQLSNVVHSDREVAEVVALEYLSEAWLLSREFAKEFLPVDQLKMNEQRGKWFISSGIK